MISSRWLLSVSLKRDGDYYPKLTLIDKKLCKSNPLYSDDYALPTPIMEKMTLVKLMRGDYKSRYLGTWIGERHFVVALDKDEYNNLLGAAQCQRQKVK
jgi:hypothetical protein